MGWSFFFWFSLLEVYISSKENRNLSKQAIMARLCLLPSFESELPTALLHLFSFLLILLHCNAISDEGRILLQIKEMEWNDTHNALSNWNASHENPCAWNGVFCNEFHVVTRVNLSNTFIAGRLTSSICCLHNLTELILPLNYFQGPYPNRLLPCKLLQRLDL